MANKLNHCIPRQSILKNQSITIGLSDTDCEQLMERCGMYGITVDQLLENFIGDLVSDTHSNGSDERMFANKWFDRCWFSVEPRNTLLRHLLTNGVDPEEFLITIDALNSAVKEKEYLFCHPEQCETNDIPSVEDLICHWQEGIHDCMNGWVSEDDSDHLTELQHIAEWIDSRNCFLSRSDSKTAYSEAVRHFRSDVIEDCFDCYEYSRCDEYCI